MKRNVNLRLKCLPVRVKSARLKGMKSDFAVLHGGAKI